MGNAETLNKPIRQSSSGQSSPNFYKQITSNASWNDLDNKIASGLILDEVNEDDKMEINKKKLNLSPEFANLEYKVKFFTQRVSNSPSNSKQYEVTQTGKTNNNRYEGTFKDGQLFGQGIYFYPSGSIYMGGIKDNGRDGQGIFYFANGNIYSGQWQNNDQSGLGKFFFVQNEKLFQFYYGYFKNSLYQGFGCYCYQQKYYIGYWKEDKYEGHGKIFSFEGKLVRCGIFKQDKLIQELPEEEIQFPQNWQSFLPNFSRELNYFQELVGNKPLV
ncbi:hypothetical protein ABPG74_017833 [Tetrahymena malaccensis]